MDLIETFDCGRWDPEINAQQAARLTAVIERGKVLFLPRLAFALSADERRFLSPRWSDRKAKNISYDPACDTLKGTSATGDDRAALKALIARYVRHVRQLLEHVCPRYAASLSVGRASFRPIEIAGRSPRSVASDDTLLHVDAFASQPTQGHRILRAFSNVNPEGKPRVWNIGEPFEAIAARLHGGVGPQFPGSAWLLAALSITKSRRSPYDHIMLRLHNMAKADHACQNNPYRERFEFPAGSTWIVYTDRVMHAALAGQYLLEQTFYLPVAAMQDERFAPLRVLEQIYQRELT